MSQIMGVISKVTLFLPLPTFRLMLDPWTGSAENRVEAIARIGRCDSEMLARSTNVNSLYNETGTIGQIEVERAALMLIQVYKPYSASVVDFICVSAHTVISS